MTAWKKERQYTSGLNSGLIHDSNSFWFILDQDERRLASRPSGGSITILFDLCSMPSGNESVGFVVSHNLKSLCAFLTWSDSKRRSSTGSHFFSRWQFCSNTQVPFIIAVLIASSAFSSDPWPKDSSNRFISCSSFLPTMSARGSAPGLSIYRLGVLLSDILKISWMLGYFGLTYSGPILSTIYMEMPSFRRSTLNILRIQILERMSIPLYPQGISASSGLGQS